jgi:hypothetical protein
MHIKLSRCYTDPIKIHLHTTHAFHSDGNSDALRSRR